MKESKIHVVTITTKPEGKKLTFFVRDESPAKARNWLLDNNVEVRVASQADIIDMVKNDTEVLGPNEPDAVDKQVDAFTQE